MRRALILNVLLLVIITALVVQIAALWWRTQPEVEQGVPREAKPSRQDVPNVTRRAAAPDLALKIANKDLFDQSRSLAPVGPAPTATLPVSVQPLTVVLLGVIGTGDTREALVKDQTQPKPTWLRQGEEIGGYKVGRIDPRAIVMVAPNGEEVTLQINIEKGKAPTAPAGPAGIQPTPHPAPTRVRPGAGGTPVPAATAGNEIREKIERLRQEARKRRAAQQGQGE